MLKPITAAAALAIATAIVAPVAPALADPGAPTVRLELGIGNAHYRGGRYTNINRRQAVRIASRYGLARVRDIDFRRGVWDVQGRTYRGGWISVEISARTGRVLDVDRGRGFRHGRRFHDDHRFDGRRGGGRDYDWDHRRDRDRDGRRDGRGRNL